MCVCALQGYYFNTNNPYRDWPNVFAEAQEKAREGDLNTAVLLLEAAILQDPQDSEVMRRAQLFIVSLCLVCNSKPSVNDVSSARRNICTQM